MQNTEKKKIIFFIRINFLLFNRVLARTHGIAIYSFLVGMGICPYGYFMGLVFKFFGEVGSYCFHGFFNLNVLSKVAQRNNLKMVFF